MLKLPKTPELLLTSSFQIQYSIYEQFKNETDLKEHKVNSIHEAYWKVYIL